MKGDRGNGWVGDLLGEWLEFSKVISFLSYPVAVLQDRFGDA